MRSGSSTVLEEHRATWQPWHVWAETERQLRGAGLSPADLPAVAGRVVDASLARSVRLSTVEDPTELPVELRRRDGASVFTVAGTEQYTSLRILAAEQHLLDAAHRTDGYALHPIAIDLGLIEAAANGRHLDAGQAAMVQTLATDGTPGPAGHRAGRGREDHRPQSAGRHLDGRGRPRPRPGPLRHCRAPAAAGHRPAGRHPRPAQLGPRPPSTGPGLGRGGSARRRC